MTALWLRDFQCLLYANPQVQWVLRGKNFIPKEGEAGQDEWTILYDTSLQMCEEVQKAGHADSEIMFSGSAWSSLMTHAGVWFIGELCWL